MNIDRIPESLRWMAPIAEWLNSDLGRQLGLSEEYRRQIEKRLTSENRKAFDDWFDRDQQGDEAMLYYMAMVELDTLGLLESTDPEINYEFWRLQLSRHSWGTRRGAAKMIAEDYAAELSNNQCTSLIEELELLLRKHEHPSTKLWYRWLQSVLSDWQLDGLRDARLILNAPQRFAEPDFDLALDSCELMLKSPQITTDDLNIINSYIFADVTDEYDAGLTLDCLLRSTYVCLKDKKKLMLLALTSSNEELRETAMNSGIDFSTGLADAQTMD